jgi:phosphoglycerate dehydrogenase-like enzyme
MIFMPLKGGMWKEGKHMVLMLTSLNIERIREDRSQEILQACPGAVLHMSAAKAPLAPEVLASVEIAFGPLTTEDALRAPRLRWVQIQSAGCEYYTKEGNVFPHSRVALTNASGVFDLPIAEHVIGMMLGHTRDLFHYVRRQADGRWNRDKAVVRDFSGSTVGIVGLGSIGTAVAVRARALGARVLGLRRTPSQDDPVDAAYTPDRLHEMLAQCDFVALCLPATGDTRHMIDAAALGAMRPHVFLTNIGRGGAIDTDALVSALRAGRIGGAGLDVTDPEPLPDGHPLWSMDNVIITPHTAGGSPGDEDRIHALFLKNIVRYIGGQELINRVDPVRGY